MDALILNNNINSVLFTTKRRSRIIMHVAFWLFFVFYHLIYFIPRSFQTTITSEIIQAYGLYYARYIVIFYCCVYAYRAIKSKFSSILLLLMILAISVVVTHIVTILMFVLAGKLYGMENTAESFQVLGSQYLGFLNHFSKWDLLLLIYDLQDMQLLILPVGIKMIKFGILQERNSQVLKIAQLKEQLTNLQSQLSPHFVLNIINSAFAVLLPVSKKAADYLDKIATVLRFSLYDTARESVQLKQEINCLVQLMELETLRTDARSLISYNLKGQIKPTHHVPPLLLVSLLENAFKHGVHATHQKSEVNISINITGDILSFHINNTKPVATKFCKNENSGIGLINISKRLALQFPGSHQFIIEQTARL